MHLYLYSILKSYISVGFRMIFMNALLDVVVKVLLAFGVACAVWITGYILALIARKTVSTSLSRMRFDEWVRMLNIGKAIRRTGHIPSELFGIIAYWFIIAVFVTLGFLAMGIVADFQEMVSISKSILTIYIAGLLKAFLIIIIGFILVDVFVGYVYKSTELRAEMQILYPLGEYLRIVLYIAVVTYALEQSGIGIGVLTELLIPVIWGITAAIILIVVYLIVQSVKTGSRVGSSMYSST